MEYLIKKWQRIKSNPMLVLFFLICIIYIPTAISLPSHSFRNAIIIALAIDSAEEGVEISVLTLSQSNRQEMNENNKMIAAKGETFSIALGNLETRLGRKAQMGHLRYLIVAEDLTNEDITPQIDAIVRTSEVSNSVPIIISKQKAQEVINTANELENGSGIRLSEIFSNVFNEDFLNETSIESFFKGYYSPIKTSTAGYIEITSDVSDGIVANDKQNGSGSEQGGQSQQSSSQTSSPKVITFKRNTVVFKEGKKIDVLSSEISEGLNWIKSEGERQFFSISGVNEDGLNNANITFGVSEKNVVRKSRIENNVPKINFEINLDLIVCEIEQQNPKITSTSKIVLTDTIKQKIEQEIKRQFGASLSYIKSINSDIISSYYTLTTQNGKKYNDYLNSLTNKEDFLRNIQYGITVNSSLI